MTETLNTTSEKVLAAAQPLMLSKGFTATSVDEICAEAGVSKGSFYHFFASKEELGVELLKRFYDRSVERLMSGPFAWMDDPKDRLFGFLDQTEAAAEDLWSDGCLLGTFATELAETNTVVAHEVSRLFTEMTAQFAAVFEGVVRETKLEKAPSPTELAEQYLAILEGSIILARAHNDPSRIPKGLHSFRDYMRLLVE